jgi:predicted RecA/RadA family phage recombinase
MKTWRESPEVLTFTAPTGGVVTGLAYLIGGLVVVATETVAQTLPFDGVVIGVVDVVKVNDEAWTEGLKFYWDNSAFKFTKVIGSNTVIGVAVAPIVPLVVTLATNAGAPLTIAGLVATIVTYSSLAGKTVTVTVNGVATVLTEGVNWTASVNNNTTATSLASAIDGVTGVTATATNADVTVVPGTGVTAASAATGRVRLDGVAR